MFFGTVIAWARALLSRILGKRLAYARVRVRNR